MRPVSSNFSFLPKGQMTICLPAIVAAIHWIATFNVKSPLYTPQPQPPVITLASMSRLLKPAYALRIYRSICFCENCSGSFALNLMASMATIFSSYKTTSSYLRNPYLTFANPAYFVLSPYPSLSKYRLKPTKDKAYSGSIFSHTNVIAYNYGRIANMISSWTHPFFKQPPPMNRLAKSTLIYPSKSSMLALLVSIFILDIGRPGSALIMSVTMKSTKFLTT